MEYKIPDIIAEINKKYKTNKIVPLSQAESFKIKRFFSGSFGIDYITGGGYTYKRILLFYGHKSSGKNSQLYQMLAYNQRLCRKCHGLLPQYADTIEKDRWSFMLTYYMGTHLCQCENCTPKAFVFFDYEKSLGVEEARLVIVTTLLDKETKEVINENEYNEKQILYKELNVSKKLTDQERTQLAELEVWFTRIEKHNEEIMKLPETDYMRQCGVDIDTLTVVDPKWTDEGIDIIKDLIKSKQIDGIIWDSLQSAIPKYVQGRDAEQNTMGVEAKMNGLLMRQIVSEYAADDLKDPAEAYKPTIFITSQVRSDLGAMYAKPDSFSGGNAVAHHISLALEFKREKFLDVNGQEAKWGTSYYGQETRIRAEKNKLNGPGDMFTYNYYFKESEKFPCGYIDHVGEIVNLGVQFGVINQTSAAWFEYNGKKLNGMKALTEEVRTNIDFAASIYKDIVKRF